ncbi:uncharacterized protein PV09_06389 [Verruconis gallopava]|uniref:Major facilitator superfamily (MFS) profile domain-containing protein n=1 Tax=Verruconis gallopava TaxID=253628 RepID=A0A0D1XIS9_9PEZI|nr:uncharacterized protein PV09_06389 [Verruconis gallopava]KIW02236.1 hypothetical protein PV09_06389 [Verruconis gallopava]
MSVPSLHSRMSVKDPQNKSDDVEQDVNGEKHISEASGTISEDIETPELDATTPVPITSSVLQRVITGRSASSYVDPGPPPDGGLRAWLIAVAGLCVIFNSWGYIQTFGVFQTYYVTSLSESPSTISWIGSIQIFLLFFVGPFSGRATDAGYFRLVFWAGLFAQLLGVFMTSLASKYWQLLLAQGVCQGLGNGLQFVPTMSLVSTYFDKNRSLAIGLTAVGAAFGGLVMPAMVQQLLPKIGYGWTVRALGLVIATLGIFAGITLKPRVAARKSGPLVEWTALKEPPFALFCMAMFLNFWGVYFPFIYIGSYSRKILHTSYSASISLLLGMNGVSVIGRLIPNVIADRSLGPITTMTLSSLISGIVTFCWAAVHDVPGLWAFGTFFGFFCAGIQSLFPACLASLTPDLQKRGARMGMGFAIAGIASLTGSPLGGGLVQADHGLYLYAQMWAASSFIAASTFLFASRCCAVGLSFKLKY